MILTVVEFLAVLVLVGTATIIGGVRYLNLSSKVLTIAFALTAAFWFAFLVAASARGPGRGGWMRRAGRPDSRGANCNQLPTIGEAAPPGRDEVPRAPTGRLGRGPAAELPPARAPPGHRSGHLSPAGAN